MAFDEDQHPRDDKGKFSGGLSKWASKVATGYIKSAVKGGFSDRLEGGKPKNGFMVSLAPGAGKGHVIELRASLKEIIATSKTKEEALAKMHEHREQVHAQITAWVEKHAEFVRNHPDHYFGGYLEKDEKTNAPIALHFDVSQRFQNPREAKVIGRERNQISIWDVKRKKEIKTGGTGR